MDFDDFDAEDAAILGGIIGFAEESMRDEEEYLRGEWCEPEKEEYESWEDGKHFEKQDLRSVLAGLDPELQELVPKSVIAYNLHVRIKRRLEKNQISLYEISKRLEEEKQARGTPRIRTLVEYLFARNKVAGGLREEDYDRYPDLFFIDEAIGGGWDLEFDYINLMGDRVEGQVGKVENVVKDRGKIYLVIRVRDSGQEEIIPIETLQWMGGPGEERKKGIHWEVKRENKKKFNDIDEGKRLANRLRVEFGVEVFVDDFPKNLGSDGAEVHMYIRGKEKAAVTNAIGVYLSRLGYGSWKSNSEGIRVWKCAKRSGLSLVLHSKAFEFERKKRKFTVLKKLFFEHPDYAIVTQKIAEASNAKEAKEVFLELSLDPEYGKPLSFDDDPVIGWEFAAQMEETCGAEAFIDGLEALISANWPVIHVYISNEEMEDCARDLLRRNSFSEMEESRLKENPVSVWMTDELVVFLHDSADFYQTNFSQHFELSQLFKEKPDYALIAQIIDKRKIGNWRKVLMEVIKDPRMDIYLED